MIELLSNNNVILLIRKTSFVRKGGRNFNFSVLSLYFDNKGYIGFGKGKSKFLNKSIDKSFFNSRKKKKKILLYGKKFENYCKFKFCKTKIEFFPVENKFIAGGISRIILKKTKIKNIVCKNLGSRNIFNIIGVFKKFFKYTNSLFLKF
ncbi:hypothetical protein ONB67_00635 [Candidatus Vidania fulgoroideae]|uniref:S5 DRBM domain-containing protein n=1 Tax=Candidatus Vidania fulgoroideorum TaxID=881286 RepID=A0AAX3NBF3_9PROT|nr:hypothetical protein ONB67_00635 [Candidatus Vidania fulgoroideae]